MKYIRVSDGLYPCSDSDIRKANPNVSFHSTINEDIAALLGFKVVNATKPPSGDVVSETQPTLKDGVYYQAWSVRDFTYEELKANAAAVKEQSLKDLDNEYSILQDEGVVYSHEGKEYNISVKDSSFENILFLYRCVNDMTLSEENNELLNEQVNVFSSKGDIVTLTIDEFKDLSRLVIHKRFSLERKYMVAKAAIISECCV